ncbi:hypothetical protein SLG_12170 [Sphingobium sp. SYK-6]|uniref:hypothetical protein n=1 Tax=Sphingobium sp. (strain NBRC 103272 / SYK-6) TaxID=627192 RepID=UPI0002277204|nr:hypothetical protein [Sphingobium sp. SYK-6]BAK65892.1 hypothetical protein SLG_12170 [Sphingobium sp. SYK-6]
MSAANTMYTSDDPRSKLTSGSAVSGGAPAATGFGPSHYVMFGSTPPQIDDESGQTWFGRGQNFVVAYTRAKPGAVFERKGQVDEYVLLIEDRDVPAVIAANGQVEQVPGYAIVIVPPGESSITLPEGGEIVRLFSRENGDVAALAANAAGYAVQQPNIPAYQTWPEPPGGYRIRPYSLDVPAQPGRFGRIWRCTTFMVNVFEPDGPRDTTKLSPHFHDDFEQCSLALGGSYVHHLRWPWTANQAEWRDDEHMVCPAPSIAVIPPKSIHTSASIAPQDNRLVDVFAPPRRDFSQMEGWVLNADDYPMPEA